MEAQPEAESGHYTQTDPIGIAGGLNTYGYAGGDPINFSDPFGLCPPEKTGRPCRTYFIGGGLSMVIGGGGSIAVGITLARDQGIGVYVSSGVHAGIDASLSVEVGAYESRTKMDGQALETCAGGGGAIFGGQACATTTAQDPATGFTAKAGLNAATFAIPVTVTAGGTTTHSLTTRDIWEGIVSLLRDEDDPEGNDDR